MDVTAWLRGQGFEAFAESFDANGVDGDLLRELSNEDLKDLGVLRLADRKRLLKAIAALASEEGAGGQPLLSEGERRQVTVLFADIAGFTRHAADLGGEATHDLLNRYFGVVDRVIEEHGGSIDKHMGDNVMAVYGAPVAHSNDPERALSSALTIHRAMEGLSADLDLRIEVHIGIASGQVVASGTGSDAHREYTVTGDCVNLAARLQSLAKAGETLISEELLRAASGTAVATPLGSRAVKGFDRALEVWSLSPQPEGAEEKAGTKFVGRRQELRAFRRILEKLSSGTSGHCFLLRGEPGIGKSRLAAELQAEAALAGAQCHAVRCLDFGVARRDATLGGLLRGLLGLPREPSRRDVGRALFRGLADGAIVEGQEIFLYGALAMAVPEEDRAAYDAMDGAARAAGLQESLRQLVQARSRGQALLIFVEDIHWAEAPLLEQLQALAALVVELPLLFLATARPEGSFAEGAWPQELAAAHGTVMDLAPLSREDALVLADDLAPPKRRARPGTSFEGFVVRAEGNPLYLEQLLWNAAEGEAEELPDSLQGLMLARVDRFSRAERRALQAAAVLGQRFSLESLSHLLDGSACDLANLLRQRILRSDADDYGFAHALLREGVYSSILKGPRRDLHVRAAGFFAQRDAVLHAQHLDRAEAPEAAAAYVAAAEKEAAELRFEAALTLVKRALDLAPGELQHRLLMMKGELLRHLGTPAGAITAYREAAAAAHEPVSVARAEVGLAESLRLTDRYAQMFELLDRLVPRLRAAGLAAEEARALQLRSNVHFIRGDIADCLRVTGEALKAARRSGSAGLEAQALGGLAEAEFARGHMISAFDAYDACIALARREGDLRVVAANLSMRGQSLDYKNELEAALADCREADLLAREIRHARAEMIACVVAAYIRDLNDPIEGRRWSERALEIARRLGAGLFEAIALEYIGRSELQQDRPEEAERLILQALEILQESDFGQRFLAARAQGALALATRDEARRDQALSRGGALLAAGAPAHNHLWFYRDAMEASLRRKRWQEVHGYAKALERYTASEPLPWSDFFIARARALADFGQYGGAPAVRLQLQDLVAIARRSGQLNALKSLEEALATG